MNTAIEKSEITLRHNRNARSIEIEFVVREKSYRLYTEYIDVVFEREAYFVQLTSGKSVTFSESMWRGLTSSSPIGRARRFWENLAEKGFERL